MFHLIFHPSGGPVDEGYFQRADEIEVVSQPLLVASIEDVLATKLLAMTEQEPHYGPVLELARALREQVDWDAVRERVAAAPFGAAFLTLAERLEIAPPQPPDSGLPTREAHRARGALRMAALEGCRNPARRVDTGATATTKEVTRCRCGHGCC